MNPHRSWYSQLVSDDSDLEKYRSLLLNEHSKLVEKLNDLAVMTDQRPSASAVLDSTQVAAWRGEGRSTGEKLEDALNDVEAAIEKLDRGTYGQCESCREMIAPDRLEAIPANRLCVKCASRR